MQCGRGLRFGNIPGGRHQAFEARFGIQQELPGSHYLLAFGEPLAHYRLAGALRP
ncbi:hypothetical protein D3C72_2092420 [compost metagenome]